MRLIESPDPAIEMGLTEGVTYDDQHPYIKDLVTGEKHPVTVNAYELKWKVWVVQDSRLWKLNQQNLIQQEPISFENRAQPAFFIYLGPSFRFAFEALSNPPQLSNLQWTEYVEQKKTEYEKFLRKLKAGQKRENLV